MTNQSIDLAWARLAQVDGPTGLQYSGETRAVTGLGVPSGSLARTLDEYKVPEREKGEVLAAFAAHKGEVTEGSQVAA